MARIYVPKRCKALFLSLLFVAFCCSTAPAAEKRVLSLDQLIQMALEYSPELKMADQEVLAAKGDLRQAKAGSLPQLELTGVIGPAEKANEPIVLFDRFVDGRRVGRLVDQDREAVTFFGRLDFTITQPLYTFGKISNRQDAAALGVEAQIAGRDKKRNEVILNIKELYYAYLI
ncbi:MAG: TolC family protein, partial [Syntrophobacteraceae bacterium]